MSWIWTIWLGALIVSFAAIESAAIMTRRLTLSRFVWNLSRVWPPLPFVAGFVAGFLACHFWWGGVVCFVGCK